MTTVSEPDDRFARARRHTRRVRFLKVALPVLGVLLVVVFAAAAWFAAPGSLGFQLGSTSIEGGRLVMQDPKLDGYTTDNRHYSVTAARASQAIGDADRIDLEGIDARLPIEDDDWVTVIAETGTFDRTANRLDITSPMTVRTENGIHARFQSAQVDVSTGSMETTDPVEIDLDGTRVTADSMQIAEEGAVMIFESRVRMRIDAGQARSASNTEGVSQ